MQFNIDSWPWKFAVVFALLLMREFIRVLSPKDKHSEGSETSKWLIETIDSAAIAIGLVLFVIQPFILQAFFIPSGSMEDTLLVQDRLLVSKLIYRLHDPEFQDVVVFKAPPAALATSNENPGEDTDYIKRCMGLPGDEIHVINRVVYRNGVKVAEPYTKWVNPPATTDASGQFSAPADPPFTYDMKIVGDAVYSRQYDSDGQPEGWTSMNIRVAEDQQAAISAAPWGRIPKGFFLMLGDHRSNSNDGHVWGFVPRANIVGKAVCVFWPATRLGLVDRMSVNPRKQ